MVTQLKDEKPKKGRDLGTKKKSSTEVSSTQKPTILKDKSAKGRKDEPKDQVHVQVEEPGDADSLKGKFVNLAKIIQAVCSMKAIYIWLIIVLSVCAQFASCVF